MENIYVVDLQFFRGDNKELILKCISFSPLVSDVFEQFVFKAPFPIDQLSPYRRREASFVTRNIHKIHWDDGFIEYNQMKHVINSNLNSAKEILIKGLEKANFLNSVLGRNVCYNVENLDCPNLRSLKLKLSGFPTENVTTLNVKVLKSWLKIIFQHGLEYSNNAIHKFNNCDFLRLSGVDLYFIPLSVLLKQCCPQFLKQFSYKFPPHIVNDDTFQKCIDYIP
uniref:Uncharacterized protein n=1 Tax=Cacopsylla melanoneura TaxID=428564 RepID=A0A8D9FBP8_9HEMI